MKDNVQVIKQDTWRIWYDESVLSSASLHSFEPRYWQQVGKVVGQAQGRGTTWFIQLDEVQGALRHYRRGGLFGKLVKDHYLFSGWEKTRSYQEWQILQHLHQAGVHVPKPIAALAVKKTLCYQADLITGKVPNARDLVAILGDRELSSEIYHQIGREIRKMHDAGVNHTDLNIHNILIDDADKVWIIDFDKCTKTEDEAFKADNLARLQRSFNKEKIKNHGLKLSSQYWSDIHTGYDLTSTSVGVKGSR